MEGMPPIVPGLTSGQLASNLQPNPKTLVSKAISVSFVMLNRENFTKESKKDSVNYSFNSYSSMVLSSGKTNRCYPKEATPIRQTMLSLKN